MANKKRNQNQTDPHTKKALIWASCVVLSILIAGAFLLAVFPYRYNAELDCQGDLGNLDMNYQQVYREQHPYIVERYNRSTGFIDTNQTEIKDIPLKLDINGISGVQMHCQGKVGGTLPLGLLGRMAGKA